MKNLLTILLISSVLLSCGAKKKLVNKEETKTEIEESTKKDSLSQTKTLTDSTSVVKIDSVSVVKTEEITVKKDEIIEIDASDEDGPITVTEKTDEDGDETLIITGADKVTIRNESTVQIKRIDELTRLLKDTETSITTLKESNVRLQEEIDTLRKEKTSTRVVDVETSGISFMTYVWIGLILLIIIAIIIGRKYLKTLWIGVFLFTVTSFSQEIMIDSIQIIHPKTLINLKTIPNSFDMYEKLDSLNKVYKTNLFYMYYYLDNGQIVVFKMLKPDDEEYYKPIRAQK